MDPPNGPSSRKTPASDLRPHSGNNLSRVDKYRVKIGVRKRTIFIPGSTANESIPSPQSLRPGYASQNARTRVSAKV